MHPNSAKALRTETERLRSIGSQRDPAMYLAMGRFVRDRTEEMINRNVILNFPPPEGGHGCRFGCEFCSWRERATETGRIFPSKESFDRFMKRPFAGYRVTVSGGGDPLFEIEKNRGDLLDLAGMIHRARLLVEVVTMEVETAVALMGEDPSCVDGWSFSAQGTSEPVREAVRAAPVARVSKVLTAGSVEEEELEDYAEFYTDAGASQIILREDFNDPPTRGELAKVMSVVRRRGGHLRYLTFRECNDNLFLVGDDILRGDEKVHR